MIENIDGSMWQMPEQKQGMFKTGFLTRVQESSESIVNVAQGVVAYWIKRPLSNLCFDGPRFKSHQ